MVWACATTRMPATSTTMIRWIGSSGTHVFICSRWAELALPLVPGAVSLFGALGCFWITYLRWKNFGNWRPWLAMCWVLMPWTLAWMTSTFSIAMFGVEGGIPS